MHSMKDDWANMGPGNCPRDDKWKSVKKPYDAPTLREMIEMRNPIREITGQMISSIQTEHERLVVDAFFVYGYTKDWVVGNVHRVQARTFPMTRDYVVKTIYSIDRHDLFAIIDKISFEVCPFDELKANISTHVEYIDRTYEEGLNHA